MKRTIFFLLLVSCMVTFASAQENNPERQRRNNENRTGKTWQRHAPQHNMRGHSRGHFHHGPSRNQVPDRQRPSESRNAPPRIEAESVSISGNLSLVQGRVALTSGGTTYLIGGLNRYFGFIDGLREGAAVAIEGSAFASPRIENTKFLMVQKLTIGCRDYELNRNFSRPRPDTPPDRQPQNRNR